MKDINLKILVATLFLLSFSALAQDSLKLLASYDSLRTVYGGNIFGFYPIGVTPPVLNENQKEKITNCIESLYVNNIIPKHIKGKVILEITSPLVFRFGFIYTNSRVASKSDTDIPTI